MKKKYFRQSRIEQLINQYPIGTQEDLMRHLNEIGIKATCNNNLTWHSWDAGCQACDGHGHLRYTIFKPGNKSEEEHLRETINEVVIRLTQIEFMNVIKTLPSNGNLS